MQSPQDAAAGGLPASEPRARPRWWIRPAPGPETPGVRDRRGAQLGMALAIGGAGLFWLALGAALMALLHG